MIYALENVQQKYGTRTVLNVPALQLHEGEIFALVGPSGAGKSTLLRLLGLLEAPTQGTVRFCGGSDYYTHNTATIDVRRQITMVFQRPLLLSRSVRANVAYGLNLRGEKRTTDRVDAILDHLALSHLADARPSTLSGGEMQRVSIARAMILQPRVLLLDEPTANLDPYNIGIIERFLCENHGRCGTTIVMITHNIFQARRLAHRVGLLYNGELVEVAETSKFFAAPDDLRTRDFTSGILVY